MTIWTTGNKSYLLACNIILHANVLELNVIKEINLSSAFPPPPILFIIYIYGLLKLNGDKCKILSFADDAGLFFPHSSCDSVYRLASGEIGEIKEWLNQYLLTLNIKNVNISPFLLILEGNPVWLIT